MLFRKILGAYIQKTHLGFQESEAHAECLGTTGKKVSLETVFDLLTSTRSCRKVLLLS